MRGYRSSTLLECIGKFVLRENMNQTARTKTSSGKTRNVEVVFSVWRVCRINAEGSVW